jgi:hypothetical protein
LPVSVSQRSLKTSHSASAIEVKSRLPITTSIGLPRAHRGRRPSCHSCPGVLMDQDVAAVAGIEIAGPAHAMEQFSCSFLHACGPRGWRAEIPRRDRGGVGSIASGPLQRS